MIHSHGVKEPNRPDNLNVLVLKKKRIDPKVLMEFTVIIIAPNEVCDKVILHLSVIRSVHEEVCAVLSAGDAILSKGCCP